MADCDAGHGCSISCSGGCGAVYNHSTGKCTKWCESSIREVDPSAFDGDFSIEVNDVSVGTLASIIGETRLGLTFKSLQGAGGKVSLKLPSTNLAGVIAEIGKQAL